MDEYPTNALTAMKALSRDREAVMGNWIGASHERLRQITGEKIAQPRVKIESVWAALGDRAAPVTIVTWREVSREEARADLVA
jgi:hypothetical protein